ncbi:MAG: cell division protein FtsZ [Flavobacteriales bacterium]|nr:cell division protein FtsZ [Flavobacteriales bacterium]
MKFDLPKELSSIIKVIGVGGGGSNAVNHMFVQGIKGVDFIVCNTDRQALDVSPVPIKLQLGPDLTEGLGAGSIPDRGKDAAQENLDEIRQVLSTRTKMLFITAGMGGGTGTGAAPVVASIARELGILTVGIVTMPFQWEGPKRKMQAMAGIEELRNTVDTLLVINNDRLRDQYGNLSLDSAFMHADNVLTTAARGIVDVITKTGTVNVDFEDVKTVMTRSGVAIMGMAETGGEDRAVRAAQEALDSPLLNDNDIQGARYVLLNIAHGEREILIDEIDEITAHIRKASGNSADVIWGYGKDDSLGDKLRITVIATGFQTKPETGDGVSQRNARTLIHLDADVPTMITQPIANPVTGASAPEAPAPPPEVEEVPSMEPYMKTVESKGAPQSSIEFEVEPLAPRITTPEVKPAEPAPEKVVFDLYDSTTDEVTASTSTTEEGTTSEKTAPTSGNDQRIEVKEVRVTPNEHQIRVEERVAKVREMNLRMRSPNGVSEYEREPAYLRKKVHLNDGPKSTDSSVSRFSLNETTDENGDRKVELRKNNPHLHDRVD